MPPVSRSASSPAYQELMKQTRALAKEKLSAKDVDTLIDAAIKDQKLSAPERAALRDIASHWASKLESPELAERLRSFANMTDPGIRTAVRAAEKNNGVVNVDEARALAASLQHGPHNASVKYTLAAVMVGARLTPEARRILAQESGPVVTPAPGSNPWHRVPDGDYAVVLPTTDLRAAHATVMKAGDQLSVTFAPGELSTARALDRSVFSNIPVGPQGEFSVHADPLCDDHRRPLSSDGADLAGTIRLVDGKIQVQLEYKETRLGPRTPRPPPDDPACSHPVGGEASGSFYDQERAALGSFHLGGTRDPNVPVEQTRTKTFVSTLRHSEGGNTWRETFSTSVVVDPSVASYVSLTGSSLGGSTSFRFPMYHVGNKYLIDTTEWSPAMDADIVAKGVIEDGLITLNITSKRCDRNGHTYYPNTWVDVKAEQFS